MRFREIIATDTTVSQTPIRLSFKDGLNTFRLREEIIEALRTCVRALLFPDSVSTETLRELAHNSSFETSLHLQLADKNELRVRRGVSGDSVALDLRGAGGAFETKAKGVEQVQGVLTGQLGLEQRDRFTALHLGPTDLRPADERLARDDFAEWLSAAADGRRTTIDSTASSGAEAPGGAAKDPFGPSRKRSGSTSPEEISRLREEYERAEKAEAIEERIKALEERLEAINAQLRHEGADGELADVQSALDEVEALDLSDEDISILRNAERRLAEFEQRKRNFEERRESLQRETSVGDKLWRNPVFIPGTVLAVVCTVVSIIGGPGLRLIALGNVVCLAGTLVGILQYLKARDKVGDHIEQLRAVETGLESLIKERRTFEKDLKIVRRKHHTRTVEELEEIWTRKTRLEAAEERLREESNRLATARPEEQTSEGRQIRAELQRLRSQREHIGDCPLASFQIAQELAELGVDLNPTGAVGRVHTDALEVAGPLEQTIGNPYPALAEAAKALEMFTGDALTSDVSGLWGRLLSALLERSIPTPQLSRDGRFSLEVGQTQEWDDLPPREQIFSTECLCLTLLLSAVGRVKPSPWPIVMRFDPFVEVDRDDGKRLEMLYQRLTKHLQMIVMDSGARKESWL